jgi:uncharacterized protein YeaO (DUF488 family)
VPIRIVRLGTPRARNEGVRLGTVRRPPRGVRKDDYARENWYDVWLPDLSPSAELVKAAQAGSSAREWAAFVRRFRAELAEPGKTRLLGVLAALSHDTNFSVGCYCEDETRCHRSVLREILAEHGASLA